jgi:DNA repair photolyase
VRQLLERAGPTSAWFYTLIPYVGCLVGCRFCYAQSLNIVARRIDVKKIKVLGSCAGS